MTSCGDGAELIIIQNGKEILKADNHFLAHKVSP